MDTTQTTTHISLCAGYGGIDIGLKRAIPNLRTVAFSEIEAFACANLVSKMEAGLLDPAPVWTNLKTFPWEGFRRKVDILSGGYPCQPFSSAGKRLGKDDPRHLWPYIADGIRILQPALCFFENVEGHVTLGLRDVLHDLGELGYRTSWGIFSASEVGAPHQRKRVFILAHRKCAGLEGWVRSIQPESIGRGTSDHPSESGDLLVNPVNYGGGDVRGSKRLEAQQPVVSVSSSNGQGWPSRPGQPQFGWEPPRVVGNADSRRLEGAGSEGGRTTDVVRNRGEGSDENLGDAEDRNGEGQRLQLRQGQREHRGASGCERDGRRETQPSLGRDSDGPAGRMDCAQLCVAGDNRVDELRLLGNGVVPATATRAFLTLIKEL